MGGVVHHCDHGSKSSAPSPTPDDSSKRKPRASAGAMGSSYDNAAAQGPGTPLQTRDPSWRDNTREGTRRPRQPRPPDGRSWHRPHPAPPHQRQRPPTHDRRTPPQSQPHHHPTHHRITNPPQNPGRSTPFRDSRPPCATPPGAEPRSPHLFTIPTTAQPSLFFPTRPARSPGNPRARHLTPEHVPLADVLAG